MERRGREVILADRAPAPIGPYSVAVRAGGLLFASGQVGIDPKTGDIVSGGVEAETRQALTNLKNVLEGGGSSLARVLKTTVFLKDMAELGLMNAVYAEFFSHDPPARSTVAVEGLPKGARVEIEAVAVIAEAHGN